jgi:hypothetical protein
MPTNATKYYPSWIGINYPNQPTMITSTRSPKSPSIITLQDLSSRGQPDSVLTTLLSIQRIGLEIDQLGKEVLEFQ